VVNASPAEYKDCTLIQGETVIPIAVKRMCDIKNMKKNQNGEIRQLRSKPHGVEMGFAITAHKVQGQTCARLILELNPTPMAPHLDFNGLYVMLSRVRTKLHLRRLPNQPNVKDLYHLTKLHPPLVTSIWQAGYNSNGVWTEHLASQYLNTTMGQPPLQTNAAALKLVKRKGTIHNDGPFTKQAKVLNNYNHDISFLFDTYISRMKMFHDLVTCESRDLHDYDENTNNSPIISSFKYHVRTT
jgi:hypothetical protein